jgi:hypothetical protein
MPYWLLCRPIIIRYLQTKKQKKNLLLLEEAEVGAVLKEDVVAERDVFPEGCGVIKFELLFFRNKFSSVLLLDLLA